MLPGDSHAQNLSIQGFWPYWKDKWDVFTVPNDVQLQGTNILTGTKQTLLSLRNSFCVPQFIAEKAEQHAILNFEDSVVHWRTVSITVLPVCLLVAGSGPNMAGKSTVMRSICAVAVLSACGLQVPAEAAVIPYIDSFTLRTFSADSPLEGFSAFAVEMIEMG